MDWLRCRGRDPAWGRNGAEAAPRSPESPSPTSLICSQVVAPEPLPSRSPCRRRTCPARRAWSPSHRRHSRQRRRRRPASPAAAGPASPSDAATLCTRRDPAHGLPLPGCAFFLYIFFVSMTVGPHLCNKRVTYSATIPSPMSVTVTPCHQIQRALLVRFSVNAVSYAISVFCKIITEYRMFFEKNSNSGGFLN